MQRALLDEIEPLVFGYVRSLGTPGAFELGVRLTHAIALGVLLDLRAGRVRVSDPNALRRQCHDWAARKIADPHPLLLQHEGDEETGMLTPVAIELAERVEAAVDDVALAARRLRGSGEASDMDAALTRAGITTSSASQ